MKLSQKVGFWWRESFLLLLLILHIFLILLHWCVIVASKHSDQNLDTHSYLTPAHLWPGSFLKTNPTFLTCNMFSTKFFPNKSTHDISCQCWNQRCPPSCRNAYVLQHESVMLMMMRFIVPVVNEDAFIRFWHLPGQYWSQGVAWPAGIVVQGDFIRCVHYTAWGKVGEQQ